MQCLLCLETFAKGAEHEQVLDHPVHPKCLHEFKDRFGRDCQARDAILLLYQKWAAVKQREHPAVYAIYCPLCGNLVSDLLRDMDYVSDLLVHKACIEEYEREHNEELSIGKLLDLLFRLNLEEMK